MGEEVSAMEPVLVSIWPDAARALGIGRTKMFELIERGDIPTVSIGRRRLVPVEELRSFVPREPAEDAAPTGAGWAGSGEVKRRVRANVRAIRKARGLTLRVLAERLTAYGRPISLKGLSKLENGDRGVDVDDLVALAVVLDTTCDALLGTVGRQLIDDVVALGEVVERMQSRYNVPRTSSGPRARGTTRADASGASRPG